jgi:glycosyltransferase involved in cell wall biosynthesis
MRIAVFVGEYPAQNATAFERDMRALLASGFDLDIFATAALDPERWADSTGLLDAGRGGRVLVHHLGAREVLHRAPALLLERPDLCLADAGAILPRAARFGPVTLARTGYVLPQAWAWAAQYRDRYSHVLAYWGALTGTCAYAFHRLQNRLTPLTLWLHAGTDLRERPVLLREMLLYADNVVTGGEFIRQSISRRFAGLAPRLARKLHVVHHGLELSRFPYAPDGRPEGRILAVGRLAAGMGHEYLLRATRLLRARGAAVTLEIVGDGPELDRLRFLAGELGIAGEARFPGQLPEEATRRLIAEATVLVHPTARAEHELPDVVPEAMALGTPVVASRVAELPYALEDGSGVLVPAGDPDRLTSAIGALLVDPALRREIADRARRRVEERFDHRRDAALLVRLLRETRRRAEPAPATVGECRAREVHA